VNSESDYLEELYEDESQAHNVENEAPSNESMNLHMSPADDWCPASGKDVSSDESESLDNRVSSEVGPTLRKEELKGSVSEKHIKLRAQNLRRRQSNKRKRHELAADSESRSKKTTSNTVKFDTKFR
jgi:hypothetical protein